MKHCDQCGTEVNFNAKFCQNCGKELDNSIANKSINANLKIDLTNKTTEKIFNYVGTSLSSGVTGVKKTTNKFLRIIWPFIKVAGLVGVIGFILIALYEFYENQEREREIKIEAQELQTKNKNEAQELQIEINDAKKYSEEWLCYSDFDPASNKEIIRTASITSEDGRCELTVQKRIDGTELTGLHCLGVKFSCYIDINIKFDKDEKSTKINITKFNDSDACYIPSNYDPYSGCMSYEKFLNGLVSNNAVAIQIPSDDSFWARFSLKGSPEAINNLGKEAE